MIEIRNVSHAEGGTPILHDLTLRLPKGGVTAILGPNGAGKSTLLALMARLRPLQAGSIAYDGLDIAATSTETLARKLAILRQDSAVGSRLTVRDLVGFGRFPHHRGRPGPQDRAAVEAALGQFDLAPLAGRFTEELSGGQRQRALVAMAFAQATDYLLLDEPLNSLDMYYARMLMRVLRRLAAEHGRTVVVVLHEINYAAAHADWIVALKDGRVAVEGPAAEVFASASLSPLFGMEIPVERWHGRPVALHYE